jgi:hypothetical protein
VFVPWGYHAKLAALDWVAIPMLLPNTWRLPLLFLVSGYASRALLRRSPGAARFAGTRSVRLLAPLVFGMAVIVPPQPWVELVTQHGYRQPFGWFYAHDYFRFRQIAGLDLPTWNHLWFVVYLWVYTLLLAGVVGVSGPRVRAGAQRGFDAVFGGWGALALPAAWLVVVNLVLFPGGRETHALVGDWVAHAIYFPVFLFGFALGRSEPTLGFLRRTWPVALAVMLGAYAAVAWIEWTWPGRIRPPAPYGAIFSVARAVQGWAGVAALVGIAERFWNRDLPVRATLTEAVFPFYIVHQTVIVVVAYWLMGAGLPLGLDFAVLVAATAAGCWLFYRVGREIRWLRPLIGLRPRPA